MLDTQEEFSKIKQQMRELEPGNQSFLTYYQCS